MPASIRSLADSAYASDARKVCQNSCISRVALFLDPRVRPGCPPRFRPEVFRGTDRPRIECAHRRQGPCYILTRVEYFCVGASACTTRSSVRNRRRHVRHTRQRRKASFAASGRQFTTLESKPAHFGQASLGCVTPHLSSGRAQSGAYLRVKGKCSGGWPPASFKRQRPGRGNVGATGNGAKNSSSFRVTQDVVLA